MKNLKLALIGYGKMGQTIERLALEKSHTVILKTDSRNTLQLNKDTLKNVDVAIEFTSPQAAVENLEILSEYKVKTICGSTGWLNDYQRICGLFNESGTAFLYASNFSIGVNVFFSLNKYLAKLMSHLDAYDIQMKEAHHIQKKDAPSGTAVSIAEQIIDNNPSKNQWHLKNEEGLILKESIGIEAIREADVKGLHEISYQSAIDKITISHEAFSRDGFASGAIMAAEFIADKSGIYHMQDVLNL